MEIGLDHKRRGLNVILERACGGEHIKVVAARRDRFARFGMELIQSLIERGGGLVAVLNQIALSPQDELAADLLAILAVFGAHANGVARKSRKIRLYPNANQRRTLR